MGRIAEALKKAQQERSERVQTGSGGGLGSGDAGGADRMGSREGAVGQVPGAVLGDGPAVSELGDPGLRGLSSQLTARRRAKLLSPLPHWEAHPTVVTLRDRDSSITEQYRAVRTWLLRRDPTCRHFCLAITSSVPREGKSVTVANLAVTLAELRHLNILVVDSDVRQGQLSALFEMPNTLGLADVVSGRATLDESLQKTPLGNLSILPAGACRDLNPAELLNSTAACRVFEEIRERYHYILVDTPPVQWLTDVGVIGALCSGILMVVRMNRTPATLVQRSVSWLQANNLDVIGCVAACCTLDAARFGYREPNVD